MSGLYNVMFGVNPMAATLLAVLKLEPSRIPRFRDCYLDTYEEQPRIVVYTRTGGGNRPYYDKPNDENPDGPTNEDLRTNPNYIGDEDDSYDSTYALFTFRVPDIEGLPEFLVQMRDDLVALGADPRTPAERFRQVIADLQAGKVTPQTLRGEALVRSVVDEIAKKIAEESEKQ